MTFTPRPELAFLPNANVGASVGMVEPGIWAGFFSNVAGLVAAGESVILVFDVTLAPGATFAQLETALRGAGFDVASHISRGVGHGIAPDGLALALQFMMQHLGINPDA